MQTLFQALPVILRKAGGDAQVEEQIAFAIWRKIAGEGVARQATPLALASGILRVAVADQTWKAQLEKLAPEYVARMARLSGSPLVSRLDFVVDPAAVTTANPQTVSPINFQHTAEIVEDLRESAGAIRDDELRQIFLHAAARAIERREQ